MIACKFPYRMLHTRIMAKRFLRQAPCQKDKMAQQTDGAEAFSLPSVAARALLILVVMCEHRR